MASAHRQGRYYLGVDGGGTNTRAVIIDDRCTFIGRGVSGPSNVTTVGPETVRANIIDAMNQAVLTGGMEQGPFKFAFLCLAGVVTQADRQAVSESIIETGLTERVLVHHDGRAALAGATGGGPGIVVVSGTGSSAYGINGRGEECLMGGWGYLVGDEGSAYDIGRKAWAAATRAVDGRGPDTALVDRFKRSMGVIDLRKAIPKIHGDVTPATKVASFAPIVFEAAAAGDSVAASIVAGAARAIVGLASAAAKRLGLDQSPTDVAFTGSIARSDVMGPLVREELARALPCARQISPRFDSAIGAALLAAQADGIAVDEAALSRLSESIAKRTRLSRARRR